MAEINGQEATPVIFEYGATHFCRYCHTWGSPASNVSFADICGNCNQSGYLIPNPFPDNMIPYVILSPSETKESKLLSEEK